MVLASCLGSLSRYFRLIPGVQFGLPSERYLTLDLLTDSWVSFVLKWVVAFLSSSFLKVILPELMCWSSISQPRQSFSILSFQLPFRGGVRKNVKKTTRTLPMENNVLVLFHSQYYTQQKNPPPPAYWFLTGIALIVVVVF